MTLAKAQAGGHGESIPERVNKLLEAVPGGSPGASNEPTIHEGRGYYGLGPFSAFPKHLLCASTPGDTCFLRLVT